MASDGPVSKTFHDPQLPHRIRVPSSFCLNHVRLLEPTLPVIVLCISWDGKAGRRKLVTSRPASDIAPDKRRRLPLCRAEK